MIGEMRLKIPTFLADAAVDLTPSSATGGNALIIAMKFGFTLSTIQRTPGLQVRRMLPVSIGLLRFWRDWEHRTAQGWVT